jgi:hypothetical protein
MRETLLGKAIKDLEEFEEPEFEVDPALDMVEEEIKAAQRKFHLASVRAKKERVLIAAEPKLILGRSLIIREGGLDLISSTAASNKMTG